MRRQEVIDDLSYLFLIAHQMNTQERILWNLYLLFIIDEYMFLYIVLTLQRYIWYEPTIILGLVFPNSFLHEKPCHATPISMTLLFCHATSSVTTLNLRKIITLRYDVK
jgi:hypothetical protein